MPESVIAHLLELRLRYRRRPEARALVDRCLMLVAKAAEVSAEDYPMIVAEAEGIRDELALRFGAPARVLLL